MKTATRDQLLELLADVASKIESTASVVDKECPRVATGYRKGVHQIIRQIRGTEAYIKELRTDLMDEEPGS